MNSTSSHPAFAAAALLEAGAKDLVEANLWSLPEPDLLELRIVLERVASLLGSATLATTREIDARGAATATGATSTAAWLRGRVGLHPGAARKEVRLAGEVDQQLPVLTAALAAGEVTLGAARAVADAVRGLPGGYNAATRGRAEQFLVEHARTFDPLALSRLGRHLVQVLDPEHGAALEKQEAAQAAAESFTLVQGLDGARRFRGQLTAEHGALVDALLDPLAAPRPAEDGTPDPRPADKRRADAVVEVFRLAAQAQDMPWSGGEPVMMTVTTTPDYLAATEHDPADGPAAHLEDGTPLSPEATRRLGCDAWLVAALQDSDLAVLDIGRRSRIVPAAMRRALIVRDRGCAFPGCGRPARWCQAHHVIHWAHGGEMKIHNLVLLCPHHHSLVHHGGWAVAIDRRTRLPVFTPPAWIDPDQVPRPPWRPPVHLRP